MPSNSTRSHQSIFKQIQSSAGSTLVVLLLVAGGFWGAHFLAPRHTDDPTATEQEPESISPFATTIRLTADKQQSAGIRTVAALQRTLQETKTVAATLDYDTTRHVVLKAPVDCVVQELLVKPGQAVCQADPLAILTSSEIALARAQVSNGEADLHLAQIQLDWTRKTRENLIALLATLKGQPPLAEIEVTFNNRVLGKYRDDVLAAYTRMLLTTNVVARTRPLSERGVVAGRTVESRLSERDAAATSFRTACEQSEYESRRELTEMEATVEVARRQLSVTQERLRMLLGPFAESSPDEPQGEFLLRAPFDGRIEVLDTALASRLDKGATVLILADPTQLRVSAIIHQHDWGALELANDRVIQVSVPAFPGEEFSAQVRYIGPAMSPTTRATSLVATLDNRDGRFRPGMFAWVSVPFGTARQSLAVPSSAIQRHESEAFVFVEAGPRQYRPVTVQTGIDTSEFVEIQSGLSATQKVVDQGAFLLKSELLLEQEED